jgi:hypothetical protein
MKRLLLILLLLVPTTAHAAIAYDAVSSGTAQNATSVTASHTVTGSDTILVCMVNNNEQDWSDDMDFNGDAMTTGSSQNKDVFFARTYYLINPDTGTHTVTANYPATEDAISLICLSFTGAKQSDQPDSTSDTGKYDGEPSTDVTVVSETTMLVGFAFSEADTTDIVPADSQTEVADVTLTAYANGKDMRNTGNYRALSSSGITTNGYTSGYHNNIAMSFVINELVVAATSTNISAGTYNGATLN